MNMYINRLRDNILSVINISVVTILRGIQKVTQTCLNIEKILTDNRWFGRKPHLNQPRLLLYYFICVNRIIAERSPAPFFCILGMIAKSG